MPKQKDLKRRVRARMEKTGESYTSARAQLLRKRTESPVEESPVEESPVEAASPSRDTSRLPAAKDYPSIAGMTDDAVAKKTGRTWEEWVQTLDGHEAAALPHRDIARLLHEDLGVPHWWSQMVAVGYERIRGLRDKGQRRGGGYEVNKSKTLPVPISVLYRAFGARSRKRWLGEVTMKVKTATPEKSMRVLWEDGTPIEFSFLTKGPAKSQVALQHRRLPTKAHAEALRAFWTERLATLTRMLEKPRA